MNQPFCFSNLGNDLLDALILTEGMKFTNEFNFNTIIAGNLFGILTGLFNVIVSICVCMRIPGDFDLAIKINK